MAPKTRWFATRHGQYFWSLREMKVSLIQLLDDPPFFMEPPSYELVQNSEHLSYRSSNMPHLQLLKRVEYGHRTSDRWLGPGFAIEKPAALFKNQWCSLSYTVPQSIMMDTADQWSSLLLPFWDILGSHLNRAPICPLMVECLSDLEDSYPNLSPNRGSRNSETQTLRTLQFQTSKSAISHLNFISHTHRSRMKIDQLNMAMVTFAAEPLSQEDLRNLLKEAVGWSSLMGKWLFDGKWSLLQGKLR